jgi:hypothetical protein
MEDGRLDLALRSGRTLAEEPDPSVRGVVGHRAGRTPDDRPSRRQRSALAVRGGEDPAITVDPDDPESVAAANRFIEQATGAEWIQRLRDARGEPKA